MCIHNLLLQLPPLIVMARLGTFEKNHNNNFILLTFQDGAITSVILNIFFYFNVDICPVDSLMCVLWPFFWKQLFTWLTVCPIIQYVLEPKVWLKFCFVFFPLRFFGWNFGSNCASSLPLLSFLSHTH